MFICIMGKKVIPYPATERQFSAEKLPQSVKHGKPIPFSSAAMNCGVSCVKGQEWRILRNLGGTTDFSVP
ncbi:MAG TPA: hypothetical protein VHO94_02295 [Oscillospiraceae bacterium]|nr:hypothetical protein [Oscillospiraceae bacterium]